MRTNIEIDDQLMADALKVSGAKTKREVVQRALTDFIRLQRQGDIRKLRGKINWIGDLDAMRRD
jgi:Arc/MetJ family transcription regulator